MLAGDRTLAALGHQPLLQHTLQVAKTMCSGEAAQQQQLATSSTVPVAIVQPTWDSHRSERVKITNSTASAENLGRAIAIGKSCFGPGGVHQFRIYIQHLPDNNNCRIGATTNKQTNKQQSKTRARGL
eukprot:TRINITY_DN3834_c0_g1_i2.p1 TRINITY_DN3834_c0_g1~~TRINITY_DN3834_c0_g1_i2.p1  ORF type:complete len:128 (+),score=24.49 TRINITY_DN3834_c0_g1_i2:134-517(+)